MTFLSLRQFSIAKIFLVCLFAPSSFRAAEPVKPSSSGKTSDWNKAECNGPVGFSGVGLAKVHPSGLVSFRNTLFTSGTDWNAETGVFTVSCPGTYSVTFSAVGEGDTRVILKKRPTTSTSWINMVSTAPGAGSNGAIISLKMGEQIGLLVAGSPGRLVTSVEQMAHVTSFSAHKIDYK